MMAGKYCSPKPLRRPPPRNIRAASARHARLDAHLVGELDRVAEVLEHIGRTGKAFSGNCAAAIALAPWLRSAKLSPEPFDTASSSLPGATPARSATTIISASAATCSNSSVLLISLTTWPQPTSPQWVTSLPM